MRDQRVLQSGDDVDRAAGPAVAGDGQQPGVTGGADFIGGQRSDKKGEEQEVFHENRGGRIQARG
jgi:hypothetical protein